MASSNAEHPKHDWRPAFHITVPNGALNDPNGLCQIDGTYHVFHQYTPSWPARGVCWAHWTTRDFRTWEFHGSPIHPDGDLDRNGSYSGSAMVRDGRMWCYLTGNVKEPGDYDYDFAGRKANELLCVSDDGDHFDGKRLVLSNADYPAYCSNHVRDPYVWEQGGEYHMLLGVRTVENRSAVILYHSRNGIDWQMEGSLSTVGERPLGYMWECPGRIAVGGRQYLLVCPQGVPKRDLAFQSIYNCGVFPLQRDLVEMARGDSGRMEASGPQRVLDPASFVELDYGFEFYAPQAFTDESGRTILMGWVGLPDVVGEYDDPTQAWKCSITVPRELSANAAGRLCQWPVAEVDALRSKRVDLTPEGAHGSSGLIGSSPYDMVCMDGAVGATVPGCQLDLLVSDIRGEGRICLNADLELSVVGQTVELAFLRRAGRGRGVRRVPLSALSEGALRSVRVLVDTSVVEIFLNGGEVTLTTRWYPDRVDRLGVSSTFEGDHSAWLLDGWTFAGV